MANDEETPLLWRSEPRSHTRSRQPRPMSAHSYDDDSSGGQLKHKDVLGNNPHAQFCTLTGCPPSNTDRKDKYSVPQKSLYGRTTSQLKSQNWAYNMSAALSNTLLLSQVILGAALTGLGASESSHILITVFGALNTVIAGVTAYLKSRGQPMRARMYRDDLERVVEEIENSEVMWRGISEGIHGYDDIDTDEVTVRSEVARLTRLYERALRLNGMNNPDMYMAGAGGSDTNASSGLRSGRGGGGMPAGAQNIALPAVTLAGAPQPSGENPGPAVPLVENPDDVAPATKAKVNAEDKKKEEQKPAASIDGASDGIEDGHEEAAQGSDSTSFAVDKSKVTNGSASASKSKASSSPPPPAAKSPTQTPSVSSPAPGPAPVLDPDASPATQTSNEKTVMRMARRSLVTTNTRR